MDSEATTTDAFFGGRLRLEQFRRGHRVGTDAVLLAAAAGEVAGACVDAGAGVGAAGLAILARSPSAEATLVEIDPQVAELARGNVAANGFSDRARIAVCDICDARSRRAADLRDGQADVVVANPPWLTKGQVRAAPDGLRALAHVAGEAAGIEAWMRALASLARPDARMIVIHRVDALRDLLNACEGRFGALAVLPIFPRAERPAHRVLIAGRKGSRAPMRVAPPLTLHADTGAFTSLAHALHTGEAILDF